MAFSIFSDEELDQLLLTASQQYEDEEEKEERLRVKYQDMLASFPGSGTHCMRMR